MKFSIITLVSIFTIALLTIMPTSGNAQETVSATSSNIQAPILPTAPLHITKLEIIDTVVGTGEEVLRGSIVEVHYTGWIYNNKVMNLHGAKFDSSYDAGNPLAFKIGARQVIRGWDMGVIGMKVGGKRTLLIPAYLAYSTQGSGNIPPNSHLVFDIELLAIKK